MKRNWIVIDLLLIQKRKGKSAYGFIRPRHLWRGFVFSAEVAAGRQAVIASGSPS